MVDVNLLVRELLLSQSSVTALLGTNANSSIYCGYDLPEHFDPTLGPAIQIFRAGGLSHAEILELVDARVQVRVWANVEKALLASQVYGAIHDVLHGACGISLPDGTIIRSLEVTGPQEVTDPEAGWVSVHAFYAVMANASAGRIGIGGSLTRHYPIEPPDGELLTFTFSGQAASNLQFQLFFDGDLMDEGVDYSITIGGGFTSITFLPPSPAPAADDGIVAFF